MPDVHHFSPPGTPTDLIRDTAISGEPYPIKGCVIWGQNPIQTIPNQEKTIKMLEQMDFVMCVDVMPTDITMYADILLPDTSYLERYDMIKTGTQWDLSAEKQQQYIAPRMPLVAPGFERRERHLHHQRDRQTHGLRQQDPGARRRRRWSSRCSPAPT